MDFETADYGRDSACARIVLRAAETGVHTGAFLK